MMAFGLLVMLSGVLASHLGIVHSGLMADIGLLLAVVGLLFL